MVSELSAPQISMSDISKSFPGIVANDQVSIQFEPFQIHALLGENGAGKSTLMNILCGIYQPDNGSISVNKKLVKFKTPQHSIASGIGMVHQHFRLVSTFTVAENLHLGWDKTPRFITNKKLLIRAKDLISKYDFNVSVDSYIEQLSIGEQQRVEILKALSRGANTLILDEPTAVLTPDESKKLFITLRKLAKNGYSIIIISHKLKEVVLHTDIISVLRKGKKVVTMNTTECDEESLGRLMIGRTIVSKKYKKSVFHQPKIVAEVRNICANNDKGMTVLNNISFKVKAGEILGIAGVTGNGQRELSEVLSGIRKTTSGSIKINGVDLTNKSSKFYLKQGLGFIPEDRIGSSLASSKPIYLNASLREYNSEPLGKNGLFYPIKAKNFTNKLIKTAKVDSKDINIPVANLSGGNQQRLILHREVRIAKHFLIVVYPTRGLDIAAMEDIRKILIDLRNKGVGILLISEELDEIFSLSDRVAVIFQGSLMDTFEADEAELSQIGLLMGGSVKNAR